jgi:nucleoid-associated protein YgaU
MYAMARDQVRIRSRRPEAAWKSPARRLAVAAAMLLFFTFGLAQAAHGSVPAGYELTTVRAGDTLWSLATDRYPGADVRAKVDQIMRANGLHDPTLHPGEVLKLPSE